MKVCIVSNKDKWISISQIEEMVSCAVSNRSSRDWPIVQQKGVAGSDRSEVGLKNRREVGWREMGGGRGR